MDFMVGVLKMPLRKSIEPLPHASYPATHSGAQPLSSPTTTKASTPQAASGAKRGEVEFRDVVFRYPNSSQPLLRSVSFKVGTPA